MKLALSLCLLALLAGLPPAFGQGSGTPSVGAQSQGTQQRGSVQQGAGSKGDVTPGASGPQSASGEGLEPGPATFDLKPPVHPFYGPGQLPIGSPDQMRCEVIRDSSIRQNCEEEAARLNGG